MKKFLNLNVFQKYTNEGLDSNYYLLLTDVDEINIAMKYLRQLEMKRTKNKLYFLLKCIQKEIDNNKTIWAVDIFYINFSLKINSNTLT